MFSQVDEQRHPDAPREHVDNRRFTTGYRTGFQRPYERHAGFVDFMFPPERFPPQPNRPSKQQAEASSQSCAFHGENDPEPCVRRRHELWGKGSADSMQEQPGAERFGHMIKGA